MNSEGPFTEPGTEIRTGHETISIRVFDATVSLAPRPEQQAAISSIDQTVPVEVLEMPATSYSMTRVDRFVASKHSRLVIFRTVFRDDTMAAIKTSCFCSPSIQL